MSSILVLTNSKMLSYFIERYNEIFTTVRSIKEVYDMTIGDIEKMEQFLEYLNRHLDMIQPYNDNPIDVIYYEQIKCIANKIIRMINPPKARYETNVVVNMKTILKVKKDEAKNFKELNKKFIKSFPNKTVKS